MIQRGKTEKTSAVAKGHPWKKTGTFGKAQFRNFQKIDKEQSDRIKEMDMLIRTNLRKPIGRKTV